MNTNYGKTLCEVFMQEKNPHAAALGRMARGVKKTITPAEREARRQRLAEARKTRWNKQQQQQQPK